MAKKQGTKYIRFIAEYADGTTHHFQIPEHKLYKSDGGAL
jgi:hypothetical protein